MPRRLSRRARRHCRQSALSTWCVVTLATLLLALGGTAAYAGHHPAERSVGVATFDTGADDDVPARPPVGLATLSTVMALTVAWIVAIVAVTCGRDRDAPDAQVARLRGPPHVTFIPSH